MRILAVYHSKIAGALHWRRWPKATACGIEVRQEVAPNYGPITCRECWSSLGTAFGRDVKFWVRGFYENGMVVPTNKIKTKLGPYINTHDANEALEEVKRETVKWKTNFNFTSRPTWEVVLDLDGLSQKDIEYLASKGLFWSPEV